MKLNNTVWKLKNEKALTVVYFGGSITENGMEYGWRGLTTDWLRSRYPDAVIREINAAVGGTGTQLGVYRCDEDVIRHRPDLVFIEFALNDGIGTPVSVVSCNIESIYRKLRRRNPYVDIVEVFTTSKSIEDHLATGGTHNGRGAHRELTRHYHLPDVVDLASPLARAVLDARGDWLKYTEDTVHPNREGYRIMGDAAIAAVEPLLSCSPRRIIPHIMPEPLCDSLLEDAHLVDSWTFVQSEAFQPDIDSVCSWGRLPMTLCGRYPHTIGSNKPGAEVTFCFEGESAGLYYMKSSDSGDFEYRVDGGAWKHWCICDAYALSFTHAGFLLLVDHLDKTKPHKIILRVCGTKNEQSTGHWVRIGALAVG